MIIDITQLVVAQPEIFFSDLAVLPLTQVVVSGSICSSEKNNNISFGWSEPETGWDTQ